MKEKFINSDKEFLKFPGIENEELVKKYMNLNLEKYARFGICFDTTDDGRRILIWTVQPDGRYWADDDGFGMEDDDEINLYAYVDDDGNFLSKFRIYDIGNIKFFGTDNEEKSLRELERRKADEEGKQPDELMRIYIDKAFKILLEEKWPCYVVFDISETNFYVAYVEIEKRKPNWSMSVNLGRKIADRIRYICTTYIATNLDKDKMIENLNSAEIKEKVLAAVKFLYQKKVLE